MIKKKSIEERTFDTRVTILNIIEDHLFEIYEFTINNDLKTLSSLTGKLYQIARYSLIIDDIFITDYEMYSGVKIDLELITHPNWGSKKIKMKINNKEVIK